MARNDYRFVLPRLQTAPIGTQGETAAYIPYRLEEGVTEESIRAELRRQPHMTELARALDHDRRIYLLDSPSKEVLQLAAEYIGTFYRLYDPRLRRITTDDLNGEEDGEDSWREGDPNARTFDFKANLPWLNGPEVRQFYNTGADPFGRGGWGYLPDERTNRLPWWLLDQSAPVAVYFDFAQAELAQTVGAMSRRKLILLLHHDRRGAGGDAGLPEFGGDYGCDEGSSALSDLAFELECEVIRLPVPEEQSRYKKEVLAQLVRRRGLTLARGAAGPILSLIANFRGDTDNATLSKSVSNALLRRGERTGPLGRGDFKYLSLLFESRRAPEVKTEDDREELIGQDRVREQLGRVVDSIAFQEQRRKLGLPCESIHKVFAFMGAPGTGKTTWALRLAHQLSQRGLLEDTSWICLNAAELKAKYVGHTTARVKALFDQHGVIILDEAYSLTEGTDSDCFTREALAQLCVELEKHGEDRMVVFAGYGGSGNPEDDRMLNFLRSNPGLSSRVSFKVSFDSFRPEELVQVFRAMMKGYAVPPEADAAVEGFFRQRVGARAFGNCREARNLAERVKMQAAVRLSGEGRLSAEKASRVLPADVTAAAEEILAEYRAMDGTARTIGF